MKATTEIHTLQLVKMATGYPALTGTSITSWNVENYYFMDRITNHTWRQNLLVRFYMLLSSLNTESKIMSIAFLIMYVCVLSV